MVVMAREEGAGGAPFVGRTEERSVRWVGPWACGAVCLSAHDRAVGIPCGRPPSFHPSIHHIALFVPFRFFSTSV
jgi:hypothetical protein